MKSLIILASFLLAPALTQAAMPCQWQSNYGYLKFISPVPYWNSVRLGLTGGQTGASTSGTFNLPVPTDPTKLVLFQQQMDLIKDANARGVMISIETTGDTCYKASPLPTIAFVTTQVWWK